MGINSNMNESIQNDPEALKQKLNRDTAKIKWSALDQYQQQDAVVEVTSNLDLIAVACEFVRDNRSQVKEWLDQSLLKKVSDEQAQAWKMEDREIWAVVVAPWVLIQEQKPQASE